VRHHLSMKWPVHRAAVAAAVAIAALLAAGCGGSSAASTSTSGTVSAKSLPHVGTVLVDARGYALYMFVPDKRQQVTCTAVCAQSWPPLMAPATGKIAAGAGLKKSLLGSDPDPAGGRVVTYGGWPLYTYIADTSPGMTTGQGVDLNGGAWYLMLPNGKPLTSSG
jgi:predicted lipoprotein with Yx(FWY)xxD motif